MSFLLRDKINKTNELINESTFSKRISSWIKLLNKYLLNYCSRSITWITTQKVFVKLQLNS